MGITVLDMDGAITFYCDALQFRKVSDQILQGPAIEQLQGIRGLKIRVVQLRLGQETLALTQYLTPQGRSIPPDSRSNDLWFQHIAIVVSDMDRAHRQLKQFAIQQTSLAPQRLPASIPAAAGIEAFYFRDPEGHNLKLIAFPTGKGDARWQAQDKLFLGIDHTAIAVSNTSTSLRFYQTLLGLRPLGGSLNFGPEQEQLHHVPGARLRITSLGAPQGINLEFLEYLTPRTGRCNPSHSQVNDLWHWETTVVVADAAKAINQMALTQAHLISAGLARLPEEMYPFRRGFLIRDPDGHAVRVMER